MNNYECFSRQCHLADARSENVCALSVYVTLVVDCRGVHHGLTTSHASPDICADIFTVLHFVFFHLFQVLIFGCATMSTNSLVIASMEWITFFEWSKEWLLLGGSFLFRECNVRSIGGEVGTEGASLTHCV